MAGNDIECHLVVQNAPVAMPSWSIGEINEDDCETTFRKDGGDHPQHLLGQQHRFHKNIRGVFREDEGSPQSRAT